MYVCRGIIASTYLHRRDELETGRILAHGQRGVCVRV